jgi:serine/threonine protein kinase
MADTGFPKDLMESARTLYDSPDGRLKAIAAAIMTGSQPPEAIIRALLQEEKRYEPINRPASERLAVIRAQVSEICGRINPPQIAPSVHPPLAAPQPPRPPTIDPAKFRRPSVLNQGPIEITHARIQESRLDYSARLQFHFNPLSSLHPSDPTRPQVAQNCQQGAALLLFQFLNNDPDGVAQLLQEMLLSPPNEYHFLILQTLARLAASSVEKFRPAGLDARLQAVAQKYGQTILALTPAPQAPKPSLAEGQSNPFLRVIAKDHDVDRTLKPGDTLRRSRVTPRFKKVSDNQDLQRRFGPEAAALADDFAQMGFHFVKKIGQGGQGVVILAEELNSKGEVIRQMAIKIATDPSVDPEEAQKEQEAAKKFTQDDPVVMVYQAGEIHGTSYIIMSFLEHAEDLTKAAKEADTPTTISLCLQAAEGIHRVHYRGFIHRDIKPANFLRGGEKDLVYVTDFGLARPISEADPRAEIDGMMAIIPAGTPKYMSPRQAGAQEDVTEADDVYSLGFTFYEILTGQHPYSQQVRSRDANGIMAYAISLKKPVFDEENNALTANEVPAPIREILAQMVLLDPDERPPISTVVQVFKDYLHSQSPEVIAAELAKMGEEEAIQGHSRSNRRIGMALAALLAVGAPLGTYLFNSARQASAAKASKEAFLSSHKDALKAAEEFIAAKKWNEAMVILNKQLAEVDRSKDLELKQKKGMLDELKSALEFSQANLTIDTAIVALKTLESNADEVIPKLKAGVSPVYSGVKEPHGAAKIVTLRNGQNAIAPMQKMYDDLLATQDSLCSTSCDIATARRKSVQTAVAHALATTAAIECKLVLPVATYQFRDGNLMAKEHYAILASRSAEPQQAEEAQAKLTRIDTDVARSEENKQAFAERFKEDPMIEAEKLYQERMRIVGELRKIECVGDPKRLDLSLMKLAYIRLPKDPKFKPEFCQTYHSHFEPKNPNDRGKVLRLLQEYDRCYDAYYLLSNELFPFKVDQPFETSLSILCGGLARANEYFLKFPKARSRALASDDLNHFHTDSIYILSMKVGAFLDSLFKEAPRERIFSELTKHFGASTNIAQCLSQLLQCLSKTQQVKSVDSNVEFALLSNELYFTTLAIINESASGVAIPNLTSHSDFLGSKPFFDKLIEILETRQPEQRKFWLEYYEKYLNVSGSEGAKKAFSFYKAKQDGKE